MASRCFTPAAAAFLACSLAGPEATAVGLLLDTPGHDGSVRDVRLVAAWAPRQSTVWWSLDLARPRRRVALVVPAAAGAAFDPAEPVWFDALERATAPQVAVSGGLARCAALESSAIHDTSELLGSTAIGVAGFAVLSTLDEVESFARARGLEFAASDRTALEPYAATHRFVAVSYDIADQGGWTDPVRMAWRGAESKLSLDLLAGHETVPITLWTIARARARLPPAQEHSKEELSSVWSALGGQSDYPARRSAWLGARTETSWLIEAAGDDVLYDWRLVPGGAGAIAPAVTHYFGEDLDGECAARVLEAKNDGRPVAPACAKGLLGIADAAASLPSCVESPAESEIDPEALRCGALDDLALALGDQQPESVWVTRHRGVFRSSVPQSIELDGAHPERVSPVVLASAVDASGCGPAGGIGSGGASGVPGTGSGSGGWGGMGGLPPSGGSGTYPGERHSDTVVDEGSSVELGCTSSAGDTDCSSDTTSSSGDEGCSGDGDGSDSEESEGCGCDSSDDSDAEGGDDCSGDTTGDPGDDYGSDSGDGCSGDSSSEGGDGCSGDSSGGDSCSGDSGSGDCAGDTAAASADLRIGAVPKITAAVCSLPQRRRFRPRMSAVTLVLCAIALCARRANHPCRAK